MAELTTKSKSSLSILTGSNTQTLHKETLSKSKSLSKGLEYDEQDKDGNGNNNKKIPNSRSLASYDDLTDHKRTLYTCYSSRAITMYNVSSSLKDHTGSTPSMFTLNKTVKTQKMSRSCSGENRSINSNFSASSQNILINNTTTSGSLPKVKTFKDKIFVFKKNRTVQQWMDEFLKKNISDEKPEIIMKDIIDSNTNLSKILDLEEYNSNYDFTDLYKSLIKMGENYLYTLNHEPFWQTQPKIFPDCDVHDIQSLSRELHIFQDDPKMSIEGIKYKVIDGKVIPYEGSLDSIMDSLIFPTSQETQFTDAFLVVYRFYITPVDLLKFIISWFNVRLPNNPTKDQEFFYDENKKNIQQRCLKLLNFWIRLHWHDFSSSAVMSLLNKFMNHIGDSINNTILYGEYTKLDTVLRKQKLTLFTKQYTLINEGSSSSSKTKFSLPSDTKKPWVLMMTSQEFASQLLLHERTLFKEIEPDYYIYLLENVKLMDEEYGKFTLYKPIRIIMSYISWFHQLSQYTVTVIAEQPSLKKKIFALKKFIKVAKACLTYKNFNSAAAIFLSLKLQIFVRHHALWQTLPSELIENIEELDGLFGSSYNYHFEIQQLDLQPYPDDNVIPFFCEHIKQIVEQTKFEDKIVVDYNIENTHPKDLMNDNNNNNNNNNDNNNNNNKDNDNNNNNKSNEEENEEDDESEKKLNILNWLSINQIIMELEKWRLASKGNQGELAKNNSGNNIIGDQITAEKTANHIMNYPKWDCKKIIEQTLPYSLSLKCSNKKSSFTKYSSLQDVLAPSINELNSTHSPLSAPPLQYQRLEVQPNNVEGASNSINNTSFTSINPINPITIEDVPTTDNPTNPTTTEDVPITNIDTIPSNSLTVPELSNTLNSPNTPNTIN